MKNIPEIENLVKLISKLPGLGPKSARRIILKLISNRNELIKPMLSSLTDLFKNVTRCDDLFVRLIYVKDLQHSMY